MKKSLLCVGEVYSDGKFGLRRIVSINGDTLRYTILSAKQESEFSYSEQKMLSVIGSESSCNMQSFSTWAKSQIPAEQVEATLFDIQATRLKLSPNERALCKLIVDAQTPIQTKGMVAKGLINKGVLIARDEQYYATPFGLHLATQLKQ